ncbi:unnamed protein product [Cylicocyclus nassatus]|uniref:Uncharacterized protein n=1 Tax=Cylicocyclus nassatus TaxID=53992 RepID=A0AA36DK94_CYLNA|nr:unnamed protein product [Cylicocyclus nassatus]
MGPEEAKKRIAQFQENVNKKALIDWSEYNKPQLFSWPVPDGTHGGLLAIRARISYEFWKFFMSEGRKTLYEYNSTNGTDINLKGKDHHIGGSGQTRPVKPAIAAIMLDIDTEAWSGLPIEQLLSEKERNHWSKHQRMVDEQGEIANGTNVVNEEEEKENQEDEDRPTTSKKRSSDPVEDEPSIKKRMLQ